MFNFEKLEVWKEAIEIADDVYSVTQAFPDSERYGLSSQMRRAAVSVAANVAEGASNSSRQDYARFVEIATGSVFELVSHSVIARHRSLLKEPDFTRLYTSSEKLSRMLSGLRNSLLNKSIQRSPSTLNSQPST